MNRHLLAIFGWAICIAGFSSFLRHCSDTPTGEVETTTALTYALEGDGTVRLKIDDPAERLYLRAHLELPNGQELMGRETLVYGIESTAYMTDGNFHKTQFWLRSRVSSDEDGNPSLTGPDPSRQITDGRHIELDLQEILDAGGQLEIRPILAQEDARLLLRVERRPNDLQMRLPWQGGAVLFSRMNRFTALPWTALSTVEIEHIWRENRRPVPAVGLKGSTVELTRSEAPSLSPFMSPSPVQLRSGQATSLTVQGPCLLHVTPSFADPADTLAPEWRPTVQRIQGPSLSDDYPLTATRVEVPPDALWHLIWTAPPTQSDLSIAFESGTNRACVWGQPSGLDWEAAIVPETRRLTAWSLDKGQDIVVPVATGSRRGLLVTEARAQFAPDWQEQAPLELTPPSTVVTYQFETDDGEVLGTGRATVERSPEPQDHRIEPRSGWMGTSTKITVQHPLEATQVRFTTTAAVDLRFLVPLPVESERSPVYALPPGWNAVNAPWELAPYVSLTPLSASDLLAEERLVRFDATVRPRRTVQSRPEGARSTHVLRPNGNRLRHAILEEVRRPGAWKDWHRTALGRSTRIRVPETGVITVDYRTRSEEPGEFVLTCNGTEFRKDLTAGAGSFRVHSLEPAWNRCVLRSPEGDYLVDAPGSGRRWARRGLYTLQDTMEVSVDVPKGGTTVFARVYSADGESISPLTLKVDGGRPRLKTGIVQYPTTALQRRTPRRAIRKARLMDQHPGVLRTHQGIMVPFGDDLTPGEHTLTVSIAPDSSPVYIRFDSAAGLPSSEEATRRHWYVQGETP